MILKNFYYRLFLLTIPVLGVSCIFIGNNPSDFDGQTESIDDYYLYIHEDVLHIAIAPNEGEELLIGSGFWLVIENTYEQPVSIATDAGVRITRIIS
ncbi:MAG: hypothetical protein OEV06_12070, partial [Anaerolineae bacterium]|nr:hypothetical protein [Anaerolineae bacterium]